MIIDSHKKNITSLDYKKMLISSLLMPKVTDTKVTDTKVIDTKVIDTKVTNTLYTILSDKYGQIIYNNKETIFMILKQILEDNKYSQILSDIFSRIQKLANIITTHEDLSEYVFSQLCNDVVNNDVNTLSINSTL